MSQETQDKTLAKSPDKRAITAKVRDSIVSKVAKGILHLPTDYSVENAMQHAWYKLQEVKNGDGLSLFVDGGFNHNCATEISLVNALTEYCVQGLNTAKTQAYFIVRGKKVCMDRSYFGDEVVAKRVKRGLELSYDVVYKGEKITTKKIRSGGRLVTIVVDHEMIHPRQGEIVEVYCGGSLVDAQTGEVTELGFNFMNDSQIKASWAKGATYKPGGNSFHNTHPEAAWLRTAIRKYCKPIIATSDDKELLRSVETTDDEAMLAEVEEVEVEVQKEIVQNANSEPLQPPSVAETAPSSSAPIDGEYTEEKQTSDRRDIFAEEPAQQEAPRRERA